MESLNIYTFIEKISDTRQREKIINRLKYDHLFELQMNNSLQLLVDNDWPAEVASYFFQIDQRREAGTRRTTAVVAKIFGYEKYENPNAIDGRWPIKGNKKITKYKRKRLTGDGSIILGHTDSDFIKVKIH